MKQIILFILILFTVKSFSQEYGKPGYQKKRFDEAVELIKSNELERATLVLYFVNHYEKNELGKTAVIKADSLLPYAQNKLKNNLIGSYILKDQGSNWGFKKPNDTLNEKILIVDSTNFLFYDRNIKSGELKLIKTEKIEFSKYNDPFNSLFEFVFKDKTIWSFYFNKTTNLYNLVMTGEEVEDGRTEIVCGNKQYNYSKI